jgi:dolichol-phosphate hexosyltransferase
MKQTPKKITVVIPCYNEEKGIANVIKGLPRKTLSAMGFSTEVLVIDNNSTDRTAQIAAECGARVLCEKKQGKGYALITGFKAISHDTDIVVMIDGDDTYSLGEIIRLVEPISNGFSDVVLGTRLGGKIVKGSMSELNRIGNWIFTFLVRVAYHGNVTDVCTGYFAWNKKVIDAILPYLKSNGFSIEMEMITKMAKLGFNIISVPITYSSREGTSSLNPAKDGWKILETWFVHLNWSAEPKLPVVNRLPDIRGAKDSNSA